MKHKTALSIFAVVYPVMFLIGPWHFYGELKHVDEQGLYFRDIIDGLVGAAWDDQTFRACLKGRIDGEPGEIYVETETEKIYQQSIKNFEGSDFRRVIALPRSQYDKSCKLFKSGEYQLKKEYFDFTGDSYHIGDVQKDLLNLKNRNYFLLKLSRDQGVNRYTNYFGVYEKTKTDAGDRLAWFALKGVYHKKVTPSAFDYFLVLVKDFFTMPYQWVAMFIYASGGIG